MACGNIPLCDSSGECGVTLTCVEIQECVLSGDGNSTEPYTAVNVSHPGSCTFMNYDQDLGWANGDCEDQRLYACQIPLCSEDVIPAAPQNASRTIVHDAFGSLVTYSCNNSLTFADGDTNKTFHCVCGATWNFATLTNCTIIQTSTLMPTTNVTAFWNVTNMTVTDPVTLTTNVTTSWVASTNITTSVTTSENHTTLTASRGTSATGTSVTDSTSTSAITSTGTSVTDSSGTSGTVGTGTSVTTSTLTGGGTSQESTRSTEVTTVTPDVTTQPIIITPNPQNRVENPPGLPLASCPRPPIVVGATASSFTSSSSPQGTAIQYTCITGHVFPDGSGAAWIACQSGGVWGPQLEPCQPAQCPEISLGEGTIRDTEERHYPVTVAYHALPGYQFQDGSRVRTLICDEQGRWSSEPPVAAKKQCAGNRGLPQADYQTVQAVACTTGRLYNGIQSQQYLCTARSTWYQHDATCEDDRCQPPPLVTNASVVTMDVSGRMEFQCLKGHRFPDGQTHRAVQCQANQLTWSQMGVGVCKVITCPPVPYVDYASPDSYSALYGTVVTYTCDSGHLFSGNLTTFSITCLETGSWTELPGPCEEITCPELPDIKNGTLYGNGTSLHSVRQYVCDTGFRVLDGHDSVALQCMVDGRWNYTGIPSCEDNRCMPGPFIEYSQYDASNTTTGNVIEYSCLPGYQYQDAAIEKEAMCSSVLQWVAVPGDCLPLHCPKLSDIAFLWRSSNETKVFSHVTIQCLPGYQFEDGGNQTSLTCGVDQAWSPNVTNITCTPIICSPIEEVANAVSTTYGVMYYMDTVEYKCKFGHQTALASRSIIAECGPQGEWILSEPGCLPIECPPMLTWDGVIVNTSEVGYLVVVGYSCRPGYVPAEGPQNMTRVSTCVYPGVWEPAVTKCIELNLTRPEAVPAEAEGAQDYGAVAIALLSVGLLSVVTLDVLTIPQMLQQMRVRREKMEIRAQKQAARHTGPRVAAFGPYVPLHR